MIDWLIDWPVKAVGLGHKPGEFTPGEKKYTTSDYIIPPKVPQMSNSVVKGKPSAPGKTTLITQEYLFFKDSTLKLGGGGKIVIQIF